MQFISTVDRRTYELTPVCDQGPEPRWIMVRDVQTLRCVLAQRDSHGDLYGLDESANEVDRLWLVRVLQNAAPKS